MNDPGRSSPGAAEQPVTCAEDGNALCACGTRSRQLPGWEATCFRITDGNSALGPGRASVEDQTLCKENGISSPST